MLWRRRAGSARAYIARRSMVWALRGLLVAVILGGWVYAGRDGGISSLILPPVGEVATEFRKLFGAAFPLTALRVTLLEIVVAFLIAATTGLVTAYVLSRSKLWGDVVEPLLAWAYMFPLVMLYPIFLLWLGVGQWATIAYASTAAVIPITYNALRGLRTVEARYLRVGRAFGASPAQVDVHIKSGAARPLIQSGLRIGFSLVLISVVLAELLGAHQGLGHEIKRATDTLQNARAFALVIFLLIVAGVIQRLLESLLKPVQR